VLRRIIPRDPHGYKLGTRDSFSTGWCPTGAEMVWLIRMELRSGV